MLLIKQQCVHDVDSITNCGWFLTYHRFQVMSGIDWWATLSLFTEVKSQYLIICTGGLSLVWFLWHEECVWALDCSEPFLSKYILISQRQSVLVDKIYNQIGRGLLPLVKSMWTQSRKDLPRKKHFAQRGGGLPEFFGPSNCLLYLDIKSCFLNENFTNFFENSCPSRPGGKGTAGFPDFQCDLTVCGKPDIPLKYNENRSWWWTKTVRPKVLSN